MLEFLFESFTKSAYIPNRSKFSIFEKNNDKINLKIKYLSLNSKFQIIEHVYYE